MYFWGFNHQSPSQSNSTDHDLETKVAKKFLWPLPEGTLEYRKKPSTQTHLPLPRRAAKDKLWTNDKVIK